MNKFLQNNLNIVVGSLVVLDGNHRSADLNYNSNLDGKVCKVINIDSDEQGEYIEIETYGESTNPDFSFFDMPDSDSFYRHSISIENAPRPLDIEKSAIGGLCVVGKKIDYLPYISEFNRYQNYYYDSLTKMHETELDLNMIANSVFKIVEFRDGLVQISTTDNTFQLILPNYMLYDISPSMLYKPKEIRKD